MLKSPSSTHFSAALDIASEYLIPFSAEEIIFVGEGEGREFITTKAGDRESHESTFNLIAVINLDHVPSNGPSPPRAVTVFS